MAKATKTWKIGEYCKGGIITVEVNGNTVHIIAKEWDHSAGDRRSSDQSKAKEWDRLTVDIRRISAEYKMEEFLNDLTTSYYADEVMTYIKSKVTLGADYPY